MSIQAIYRISLIFVLVFVSLSFVSAVRINEVMYHSNSTFQGTSINEWIEVYNPSNESIDISGWKIKEDADNPQPINFSGTNTTVIGEYGYFIIAKKVTDFIQYFNASCPVSQRSFTLSDSGKNISILNASDIAIDSLSYNPSMGANGNGKSLQFYNNLWQNCTPTPGAVNFCQATPTTPTNQSNNQQTQQDNQTQVIQEPKIEIDLEYEHEVEREFEVELKASNIDDKKYDVKICVMDGNTVISEIYDDNEEKWVSGRLYVDERISLNNKKEVFNLRLKKDYEIFSGKAKINARLRESGSDKYTETTSTIEIKEYKSGTGIKNISIEKETLTKEEIIKLAPKDIKSYKSKTEYIKEYAIYGFAVFCIMLFTLIWLKKSMR